ncbi:MAG: hypothetical protein QGI45_01455 [Myxococcota bacterium]|nr:hypothetical protein [Myxococcota bacterium]
MKKTWFFVSHLFFICTSSACFSSEVDKCVNDDECQAGQACIDNRCFPFHCGDGILNVGEDCDAGEHNGTAQSSCPINCLLDDACGNGAVEGDEACDDENITDDDGCSALCAVELGYLCSGQPSVCVLSCGDGIINGNDECEDTFEGNGSCQNCQIVCDAGYAGASCTSCAPGYQDENEDGTCLASCDIAVLTCSGHGSCAISEAGLTECVCDTGYAGANCSDCASNYQDGNEDGTCLADCTLVDLDCSGNGECGINASGETACACYTGYEGESCDACVTGYINCGEGCAPACTDSETCNGHGECNEETCTSPLCLCEYNWSGSNCTECAEGYTGTDCLSCDTNYADNGNGFCVKSCDYPNICNGHGTCVFNQGPQCTCDFNYDGTYCDICAAEYTGTDCGECIAGYNQATDGRCYANCETAGLVVDSVACTGHGTCKDFLDPNSNGTKDGGEDYVEAYCTCDMGYTGTDCSTCDTGYQDDDGDGTCELECASASLDCNEHGVCVLVDGAPACDCDDGYTGDNCENCDTGYQDPNDPDTDLNDTCELDCVAESSEPNYLDCNQANDKGDCSINTETGLRGCACVEGYDAASACTTCLSGYHDVGGECLRDGILVNLDEMNSGELSSNCPSPDQTIYPYLNYATGYFIYAGDDNGDGAGTANDGLLHEDERDSSDNVVCTTLTDYSFLVDMLLVDGSPCTYRGVEIHYGIDQDADNLLDADERYETVLRCQEDENAAVDAGASYLSAFSAPDTSMCPHSGGVKVNLGYDDGAGAATLNNGTLEADEIDQSVHVCFGGNLALVRDIDPGTDSGFHNGGLIMAAGNGVYFQADDDSLANAQLWWSDGTDIGDGDCIDGRGTCALTTSDDYYDPDPKYGVLIGDKFFFSADADANGPDAGVELFVHDQQTDTVSMVMDINPDGSSSSPEQLVDFNGTLIFVANDGSTGEELWKSDGTELGTQRITDINDSGSSDIEEIFVFDDKLLFAANDGSLGMEPYVYDGTNVLLLKNIHLTEGSQPNTDYNFVRFQDKVYFSAEDADHGVELWRTDGTSGNTELIADIMDVAMHIADVSGTDSNPKPAFVFNDELVMEVDFPAYRSQWYGCSNQTTYPDYSVCTPGEECTGGLCHPAYYCYPDNLPLPYDSCIDIQCDLGLTCVANNGGEEIGFYDGTNTSYEVGLPNGVRVTELRGGNSGSSLSDFVHLGSAFTMLASPDSQVDTLWVSDGTDSGTEKVLLDENEDHSYLSFGTTVNGLSGIGTFLFMKSEYETCDDSTPSNIIWCENGGDCSGQCDGSGLELWMFDGVSRKLYELPAIDPAGGSRPWYLTNANGVLFFRAEAYDVSGEELYAFSAPIYFR